MHGTAVPLRSILTCEEARYVQAAQCGLCATLRCRYGLPFAFLANHDARFIVLLVTAQFRDTPEFSRTRCPAAGFVRHLPSIGIGRATEYAAAITVLISAERVRDMARDGGNPFWLIGLAAMTSFERRANRALRHLGFPVYELQNIRDEQRRVENTPGLTLRAYLEPTASLLGMVFAHSAQIAADPENSGILFRLGQTVGRIVSLLDACEDLSSDRAHRRYNPIASHFCLDATECLPPDALSVVLSVVAEEFGCLGDNLGRLHLPRMEELVANVLTRGMPLRMQRGLQVLWRANHWQARWPGRALVGLADEICPLCQTPHLSAARTSPKAGTEVDRSSQEARLWSICKNFSRNAGSWHELGFHGRNEHLVSAFLPVISSFGG